MIYDLGGTRATLDRGGIADGHDVPGLIEGEDEGFAAETIPGDDEFPETEAVEIGVRAVEEIDDRAVGEDVFAGTVTARDAKGNGRDGLGEGGDGGVHPDALLVGGEEVVSGAGVVATEPGLGGGEGGGALLECGIA